MTAITDPSRCTIEPPRAFRVRVRVKQQQWWDLPAKWPTLPAFRPTPEDQATCRAVFFDFDRLPRIRKGPYGTTIGVAARGRGNA